ncbi:MAG: SAM-dependent chlorinase/fluorinase [Planctomycetes bacterium]|nr:SAM-dependent chlorinase/fluorinase [Planctomycetota bacterium]
MRIITLTTDFGYRDPYVGVMKGVILGRCPDCRLVDLTHGITPHSVLEGNFSIRGSYRYFPQDSLHVIVVDPGVGGKRRILFLRRDGQCFLAPDNGVLTGLVEDAESIRSVENTSLFLQEVSSTFHGRDIFAPVAAEICRGISTDDLGPEVTNPVTIQWSEPAMEKDTIEGTILYIDVFGNLITNITRTHVYRLGLERPRVFLHGKEIGVPQAAYSIKSKGEPLAIYGSFGHLEIAVNQGNAAQFYKVGTGDEVIVTG